MNSVFIYNYFNNVFDNSDYQFWGYGSIVRFGIQNNKIKFIYSNGDAYNIEFDNYDSKFKIYNEEMKLEKMIDSTNNLYKLIQITIDMYLNDLKVKDTILIFDYIGQVAKQLHNENSLYNKTMQDKNFYKRILLSYGIDDKIKNIQLEHSVLSSMLLLIFDLFIMYNNEDIQFIYNNDLIVDADILDLLKNIIDDEQQSPDFVFSDVDLYYDEEQEPVFNFILKNANVGPAPIANNNNIIHNNIDNDYDLNAANINFQIYINEIEDYDTDDENDQHLDGLIGIHLGNEYYVHNDDVVDENNIEEIMI